MYKIIKFGKNNRKTNKEHFMKDRDYVEYTERRSQKSPCFLNCIKAFAVGGTICLIGEALSELYVFIGAQKSDALLYSSLSLIFITGLLTGIGVFDKIAKFGGGGALVPISGFANAMAAPAIDSKTEGYVTGVAAKIFTIAGPVVVYGTAASVVYGIIYYIIVM